MYGPRSAYDSATLAEMDRRFKRDEFARRLIEALQDPKVLAALSEAMREAHMAEVARVDGRAK